MSEVQQILRQNCEDIFPGPSSLQFSSGSYAAESLRGRMKELSELANTTADAAAKEFQAQRAAAMAAVEAFHIEKKAADAALHQLDISSHTTLPYPIRHDRLLSLERLVVSLKMRIGATKASLQKVIETCDQALTTADVNRKVSSRAQALSGFDDYNWEVWAEQIGAKSAAQSASEAGDQKKIIGVTIGLAAGALCVLLGWPLVQWSWARTVEFGVGGVVGSVILTGIGAFLVDRDNGFGFVLLAIGGIALLVVLLGPTILIGGGYAGYFLANASANYLGNKEGERSSEIADEHDSLIEQFLSHAPPTNADDQSVDEMRSAHRELVAAVAQFDAWQARATTTAEQIRIRREQHYFGQAGLGDAATSEEHIWKNAGFPAPSGYGLSDGLPIYGSSSTPIPSRRPVHTKVSDVS